MQKTSSNTIILITIINTKWSSVMFTNRFRTHFEHSLESRAPFIALKNVINCYIQAREAWLEGSSNFFSSFG